MREKPCKAAEEQPPDEYIRLAVGELVSFTEDLAGRDVPEARVFFRSVLVGILRSTLNSYRSVETGLVEMPERAAWGARNLLELKVITSYILKSEENAGEFMTDFIADIKEFWEAMTKSGEAMHKLLTEMIREAASTFPEEFTQPMLDKADEMVKRGPQVSESLHNWNVYVRLMEELGVDPKRKPKQGSAIAKLVEESDMFGPKYKIHSKIVHPTAFSILATTQDQMYAALLPLIVNEAKSNLVLIFTSIRDHVSEYGIDWPPASVER